MLLETRLIIEKVFNILVDNKTATAFTIRYNNNEYLITAKHVVKSLGDQGKISILKMNSKIDIDVKIHYHKTFDDIDISVLEYESNLVEKPHKLEYGNKAVNLTQDAYFFGYPLDYCTCTPDSIKLDIFRVPLIKKGIISGIRIMDRKVLILIDAHSNKGFSGGPLIITNNNGEPEICGVMSGYIPYNGPLYIKNKDENIEVGSILYKENSGIAYAYGICHVFEILESINK